MFDPVSTYRIQFHKEFTFKHLEDAIPYLHRLGIKTIYASPIFKATPGSSHGYDVTDPLQINPEIGTLQQLRSISQKLKQSGIGWLQDIVPNHMAFHPENSWLMDVLENGTDSRYASFFDIDWTGPVYNGRLMVPFLGLPFEDAIAQHQIKLVRQKNKLWFNYADQLYPVKVTDQERFNATYIKKVNSDIQLLKQLAQEQAYQLCYWQETSTQINYRRFFTVNGLICLNMQHDKVFETYHQLIKQLLDEGIFQGLRVDHIDGLYDPEGYLNNMRRLAGPGVYITVEKILEAGEQFPLNWPVQGNTGYDQLAWLNNLFTRKESKSAFSGFYKQLSGDGQSVSKSIAEKKSLILKHHLAGELDHLERIFINSELADPDHPAITNGLLKEAIAQFLIACPVYRYYGRRMPLNNEEVKAIEAILDNAGEAHQRLRPALGLLRSVLLERPLNGDEAYNKRALHFYQRCMQFTGPLMAKGVEDTLMYTLDHFIGHNEVGDSPAMFGLSAPEFHRLMIERQQHWPLGINATATHDTKRGEDVRTRLNVLTDIPNEWFGVVKEWQSAHAKLKTGNAPDANDEYFIYQTLAGAYPMPGTDDTELEPRMHAYFTKALREGKEHSDWAEPNEAYETATAKFLSALLKKNSSFSKSFARLHRRMADHGIINSLAQVLLKFTCPGIPDTYQGCELWDLSLVDPDNRRPVDYASRQNVLPETTVNDTARWQELWQTRYNGQVKLCLTQRLLALRLANPQTFSDGEYIPLAVSGKYQNNILAFARQLGYNWYVAVIPLHLAAIGADGNEPLRFDWEDTAITLPDVAPRNWEDLLSGAKGYVTEQLPIKQLFTSLPLGLLQLSPPDHRGAGVLMHITSLPSDFGMGDIGPEAHKFVDFLADSGQRYWQMLPVNPVDMAAGYSPYSSASGMAGNVLLISPELLYQDGLLKQDELETAYLPATNRADLDKASAFKKQLFNKAWLSYKKAPADEQAFNQFKLAEAAWLDDFALYQVLKQIHHNKPWHQWPEVFIKRNKSELTKVSATYTDAIEQEKWLQYVFSKQWRALKAYAAKKGVTLFGDMPFYVSYDSADVWAHPELFELDKKGNILGIAGVPPDYFSADGQLWGMPTYNWANMRQRSYKWWVQRVRKNLEYFDLIRLDHFRAFSAYWEVPGGEQTAVNGTWKPGPGIEIFNQIQTNLGSLPFVAEDLGDIDDAVCCLRDDLGLPGMRVLQFAFGNDMPASDHIPHNYQQNCFAYTGTHDNNTLKGWYFDGLTADGRANIDRYTGKKVSDKNCCSELIRLCYASVAKVAIVPLQDVLEQAGSERMNTPALAEGNWMWRIGASVLTPGIAQKIRSLTFLYSR